MIKEQINITCGANTYENCTLIVPSQVQTSTPQEETLDLEKTPNFQIVVPSAYIDKGTYEVTFSVGGNDCTANMIVMNNGSVNLTLQYVDGLTVEEAEPEPTGPQSLSEVKQLEDNTEFTFDGTVTVINKSPNNRELYVQDADGSAGIKMYQKNVGSSFSTGDVIYNGWTATKSVYNGVIQLGSISNLNYSGDTTSLIANEGSIPSFTESDTYNYYVFRNITINGNTIEDGEGNTMAIYNQFSTTIPSDAQHYNAYGVVAWYKNTPQLYPMSFELVGGSEPEPTKPYFSSPAYGEHITGTIDSESGDFKYPIEVVGSDGNNIAYDITSANIYPETGGSLWHISYNEDDDGNGGSYISRVYMFCRNAGSGDETLTFTDPNTGTTCSTTFTYDISDGASEPSFTYDGSDENSPIQVNVDLADYTDGFANTYPEVNINFVAPSSDYDWNNMDTWGGNSSVQKLYSNNDDCMLVIPNMFGVWTLGDGVYGYTGPDTAGTYLRSYSVTFNYDINMSNKFDETTGNPIDDPVAQALDGTVITFWVQYNVTGAIPTETITWNQDPFEFNVAAGSTSGNQYIEGTGSQGQTIRITSQNGNITITPDDAVIIFTGGDGDKCSANAVNLTAGTYNYDVAYEINDEYGVAHMQVVVS